MSEHKRPSAARPEITVTASFTREFIQDMLRELRDQFEASRTGGLLTGGAAWKTGTGRHRQAGDESGKRRKE